MLLFQRSVVEGSLGLILQAAKYDDVKKVGEGAEKERAALLLDGVVVRPLSDYHRILELEAAAVAAGYPKLA